MSDTPTPIPLDPGSQGSQVERSLTALTTSVRRLKVWLAVLSALVGVAVLGLCGVAVMFVGTFGVGMEMEPMSEETVTEAREAFENAYGERLDDLEVRAVSIDYGMAPFPFSLLPGEGEAEQAIYVEYRLKDSDVVVADIIGMWGGDVQSSGLLPMHGSLASRMSEAQYDRLLAAYGEQTRKPLGAVRRYNDPGDMMMESGSIPESVTIGDKAYPSKELWSATEGQTVEGDTFEPNEGFGAFSRNALVFHEDPKTGVLTYLGTEPTDTAW